MTPRINYTDLRRLWAEGVPTGDIATQLGFSSRAIREAAARLKLPPRPRGGDNRRRSYEPTTTVQTKSGYAIVAEIAAREGITLTQAMQRWHRTRRTA